MDYDTITYTPDFENTYVGGPYHGKKVPHGLRYRDYIEAAVPVHVPVQPSPRITDPMATSAPFQRVIYRRKLFSRGHRYYDGTYSVWICVQS